MSRVFCLNPACFPGGIDETHMAVALYGATSRYVNWAAAPWNRSDAISGQMAVSSALLKNKG
jgi:hypothetical protein